MDDRERHAAGMAVRRAVLGDAHVDRANAAQTDLTAPFQDLITRYAWGEIWTRPGLPRHTRSLLTIAMMVALGRDGARDMSEGTLLRVYAALEALYPAVPTCNYVAL